MEGDYTFPIKSCGYRHAWCLVCRPDLGNITRQKTKPGTLGSKETAHLAPGYVPHPSKTMWERHADRYNVKVKRPDTPYLELGSLHSKVKTKNLQPLEDILKERRKFTKRELRLYFGFDTLMIRRFQKEEREAERWEKLGRPEQERLANKRKYNEEREKRIIEFRMDSRTLEYIANKEGVTRERVRQILVAAEKRHGITLPHSVTVGKPYSKWASVAMACKVCGKFREVPGYNKNKWRSNFCDEHGMSAKGFEYWQRTGVEWWKLTERQRHNWRYKNDPRVRSMHIAAVKNWMANVKKDPVKKAHFDGLQKAATARWAAKKKAQEVKPAYLGKQFIEVPDHDDNKWVEEQVKNKLLPRQDSNLEPTD